MATISETGKSSRVFPFMSPRHCDTSNPYCVMRHAGLEAHAAPCEFDSLCHRYSQALQYVIDNPTSTLPSGPWWGGMSQAMLNVMQHQLEHANAKAFEPLRSQLLATVVGDDSGPAVTLEKRKRLLARKRK
jgi:hypothetical protein